VKNIAILFIYRLFCSLKMVILEKEAGEWSENLQIKYALIPDLSNSNYKIGGMGRFCDHQQAKG
jgi:hypothetical protein